METLQKLKEEIAAIGEKLVACQENCVGVCRNQSEGILPRCLILETNNRSTDKGSIVCGINPAPAKTDEINFYRQNGASYDSLLKFWEQSRLNHKELKNIPYYKSLRAFVDGLGLTGPILWTDIAKCQNKSKEEKLSVKKHPQTFRKCSTSFLSEEVRLCPSDWPIIAAGSDAYHALLYLCPNRALIGIPHPTGQFARNKFSQMFERELVLKKDIRERIENYFKREPKGIFRVSI
jgi:hypothetical protein